MILALRVSAAYHPDELVAKVGTMDDQIIEGTEPPSGEERDLFASDLSDLAAEARARRAGNPALRKTMQHQHPGAPFGSAKDPGFEQYQ